MLLTILVIIQIIILGIIAYFLYRFISKPQKDIEVKLMEREISSIAEDVRDGVKTALQEYNYEEEQTRIMEKKLRPPGNVYDSSTVPEPEIKSKGELIPFGLSDKEKEILRMFYND